MQLRYALKPAMQPAIMDLFSSLSGFFVGQRHQLVQSLPSFFVIALILTYTASTFLVHRNHPTSDRIAVQDQQLTRQQKCTIQNYFYALKSVMQPAIMDLFSKWLLLRSAASVSAVSTLFFRLRPHLDLFPLGVHSATIRIAHLLCPILFLMT
jgi:hypothetical protein